MFKFEILNNKRKRQTDNYKLFTIVTPKIVSAKIVDTVWTFDVVRSFFSIVVGILGRWDALKEKLIAIRNQNYSIFRVFSYRSRSKSVIVLYIVSASVHFWASYKNYRIEF
jgi:hypothetical protein